MGQTASRPRGRATKRDDIRDAQQSPHTTLVSSLNSPKSTHPAVTPSPRSTLASACERIGSESTASGSWSPSEHGVQAESRWEPTPIRTVPTKSGSARKRLSRLLPARYQSTGPKVKPLSSTQPQSLSPVSPAVAVGATQPSASEISSESPTSSSPSSSGGNEPLGVSAPPAVPTAPVGPSSDENIEATPVTTPKSDDDDILEGPATIASGVTLPLEPHNETEGEVASVNPNVSAESSSPVDKGKQKAEPDVEPSDPSLNHQLPTSLLPADDSTSSSPDPLADERHAAAQRILDAIRPAIDAAESESTPQAEAESLPPPVVVERIVDQLRSTGDPEILAALPPPPPPPPAIPAASETETESTHPNPPAALPRTLDHHHHHQEPSIASGTAMIVQGVVQTSDLATGSSSSSSNNNNNRHNGRGRGGGASDMESSGSGVPPPPSIFPSPNSASLRPRTERQQYNRDRDRGSSPGPGRRGLFRSPRSPAPEPNTAAPVTDVLPETGSAPSDADADASGPFGAIDTTEGIDVLTMLLSVVTAATGTSLMNGSSSPDLSVVSDLVNRATSSARPLATPTPSDSVPVAPPNPNAVPAAQSTASISTPIPPPPIPSSPSASSSSSPAPTVAPTRLTSPSPSPSPSRSRTLLNTVRSRLFRQRTASEPTASLPLSSSSSSPSSSTAPPSSSSRETDDDARTVRQEDFHSPPVPAPAVTRVPTTATTTTRASLNHPRRALSRSREEEHSEAMAGLRASLTRQLTQALRGDGLGAGAGASTLREGGNLFAPPSSGGTGTGTGTGESLRADPLAVARPRGPVDPSNVPLPPDAPDDFDPSTSAPPSSDASAPPPPVSVSTEQTVGLSGNTRMTFEEFLVDIQVDLRGTLMQRYEMERLRRERERDPPSEDSTAEATSSASPENTGTGVTAAHSTSAEPPSAADREAADAARIYGRHLENHVPSVDVPLNWWRMFRFPPREVSAANAGAATGATAATSPTATASRPATSNERSDELPALVPASTTASPDLLSPTPTPTQTPTSSPATATAAQAPTRTLTPVLIVGLRQQRITADLELDTMLSDTDHELERLDERSTSLGRDLYGNEHEHEHEHENEDLFEMDESDSPVSPIDPSSYAYPAPSSSSGTTFPSASARDSGAPSSSVSAADGIWGSGAGRADAFGSPPSSPLSPSLSNFLRGMANVPTENVPPSGSADRDGAPGALNPTGQDLFSAGGTPRRADRRYRRSGTMLVEPRDGETSGADRESETAGASSSGSRAPPARSPSLGLGSRARMRPRSEIGPSRSGTGDSSLRDQMREFLSSVLPIGSGSNSNSNNGSGSNTPLRSTSTNASTSGATSSSRARSRERSLSTPIRAPLSTSTAASASNSSSLSRTLADQARQHRFLRERLAAARRDVRRAREAQARERAARESYVIWVIGGFYPEEMVAGLVPHFLLGQFDHDDFWALAELLGQVKPPVASKDDIEKSGLEVIKTAQLAEYTQSGKIAENTVDRCLICLSEYEADEDVRILSCRHAFHKDCVDTWMQKGRNNCPACRSQGVGKDDVVVPEASSASSSSSSSSSSTETDGSSAAPTAMR